MKKKYIAPSFEYLAFHTEDLITESGTGHIPSDPVVNPGTGDILGD